jgi:hypothetical protein
MSSRQTDDLIDNDTVNHAHILVSELVKSAKKTIKLYTNSFCEEFYLDKNVMKAFVTAKENGILLKIISENDITSNKAYIEYKKLYNDKIENKEYSEDIIAQFDSDNNLPLNNFMIIDDRGIRYEQEKKEDICENIKDIRARATFNRPKDIKPFVSAFDKIL